jgi:hypothetical protein
MTRPTGGQKSHMTRTIAYDWLGGLLLMAVFALLAVGFVASG